MNYRKLFLWLMENTIIFSSSISNKELTSLFLEDNPSYNDYVKLVPFKLGLCLNLI